MIAPTLLVGLGGTGSKIVMRVSSLANDEQRANLGFAVFDTDINELREIKEENPFIKTIQTSTKLSVGEYLNIDTHARDTWFPVNAILNSKTLTEGAGQVRAISRLALDTAIRAGKMEPLHEAVQDLYKLEEGKAEQALRIIIVSSLAGGTGSGLILPVALYLRNYLATRFRQSANITRGFFILPEVFDEVIPGQAERNNLRSNAYATLRELDAFLMKGDATLPHKFADSVKMEFPRVSSTGFDEFNIRPYDFCFLFDAQNSEGRKLNSFNQYLDHAANCIYAQSIGPMNKRSNSSEDNTIRRLCAERGRNRYAGAGSSMLVYPFDDVKEYIALNWAKECVSKQWLVFDNSYKMLLKQNAARRNKGISVVDVNPATNYITTVETMSNNKDPFARAIVNACSIFDEDGLTVVSEKWTDYIGALMSKISADQSSGQSDLDAQREQVATKISAIEGGKESWESFQEAYREIERYKAMIFKRKDETAHTIAYTMFQISDDSMTPENLPHQLETYLSDTEGKFIHPNAVRYFLYKTRELLAAQKRVIDNKNRNAIELFDGFAKAHFDDPNTDEIETVENISERKLSLLTRLIGIGKLSGEQQDLKSAYINYVTTADEYRVNSVMALVLQEGIDYVDAVSSAFQNFYLSFESKVQTIEKRISNIAKKYENTKGTTARYVCVTRKCLDEMMNQLPYIGGSISIDSELAKDIYNKVRMYSTLSTKPGNSSYFSDIFEEGILGYFKDSLMEMYSEIVDMDIISALEAEARYDSGKYDDDGIYQFVSNTINTTRALSCPFIEKPLGEEKEPIYACAFNSSINPHDGSRRSNIIDKDLRNAGGVVDDDITKNMILFYQSFYGLRANDLSKFAPPENTITSKRDGGEYFKAYYELVHLIHPETHKSKAITPHIDRWWHIVTKMPDLDETNQTAQEQRIYGAFFWAVVSGYIDLFDIGAEQKMYRLKVDDLNMDDDADVLIVSNGTPCDLFYEVLDALAIYPELVDKIMERIEYLTSDDINAGISNPLEEGVLAEFLNSFRVKEYPLDKENRVRSIFDIPVLMKRSVTSETYYEENVLHILKALIYEIKQYLKRFCSVKDMPEIMGDLLRKQFNMYISDLEIESQVYRDIFQDYLFSRTCGIIAKEFEELGLRKDARIVQAKVAEVSAG